MLHISIKAEPLFNFFGFTITNSYISTLLMLVVFAIIAISYHAAKTNKTSNTFTILLDFILELFPLLGSFFFFIITSNWLGLLPGFGSIILNKDVKIEHAYILKTVEASSPIQEISKPNTQIDTYTTGDNVSQEKNEPIDTTEAKHEPSPHLLRAPTADLNTTIALGLIAMFFVQYYGVTLAGAAHYAKKFFNFSNPINFFVGILELISDFVKIISFGFRLFGNIFAGEVVLAVVAFIVPFFASFPFLLFEFFAGFIQAVIFTTLSAVFMMQAAEAHH
jgi:F-type H+-transporting ATPase subunit a